MMMVSMCTSGTSEKVLYGFSSGVLQIAGIDHCIRSVLLRAPSFWKEAEDGYSASSQPSVRGLYSLFLINW